MAFLMQRSLALLVSLWIFPQNISAATMPEDSVLAPIAALLRTKLDHFYEAVDVGQFQAANQKNCLNPAKILQSPENMPTLQFEVCSRMAINGNAQGLLGMVHILHDFDQKCQNEEPKPFGDDILFIHLLWEYAACESGIMAVLKYSNVAYSPLKEIILPFFKLSSYAAGFAAYTEFTESLKYTDDSKTARAEIPFVKTYGGFKNTVTPLDLWCKVTQNAFEGKTLQSIHKKILFLNPLTPKVLFHFRKINALSSLILRFELRYDFDGKRFPDQQSHEVEYKNALALSYLRMTQLLIEAKHSSVHHHFFHIAHMIALKGCRIDINGKVISGEDRCVIESVAEFYRRSGTANARLAYAYAIAQGLIRTDWSGKPFEIEEKGNEAVKVYEKLLQDNIQFSIPGLEGVVEEMLGMALLSPLVSIYNGKKLEKEEKKKLSLDLFVKGNSFYPLSLMMRVYPTLINYDPINPDATKPFKNHRDRNACIGKLLRQSLISFPNEANRVVVFGSKILMENKRKTEDVIADYLFGVAQGDFHHDLEGNKIRNNQQRLDLLNMLAGKLPADYDQKKKVRSIIQHARVAFPPKKQRCRARKKPSVLLVENVVQPPAGAPAAAADDTDNVADNEETLNEKAHAAERRKKIHERKITVAATRKAKSASKNLQTKLLHEAEKFLDKAQVSRRGDERKARGDERKAEVTFTKRGIEGRELLNETHRKIADDLIAAVQREGHCQIKKGDTEVLTGHKNCFSLRINNKHRLVLERLGRGHYQVISCYGHYGCILKK